MHQPRKTAVPSTPRKGPTSVMTRSPPSAGRQKMARRTISGADQLGSPLGVGGDLADEERPEAEPDQDEEDPGGG